MGGHFDLSAKQKQIEELEKKTENPSFWNNREAAEETLKQIASHMEELNQELYEKSKNSEKDLLRKEELKKQIEIISGKIEIEDCTSLFRMVAQFSLSAFNMEVLLKLLCFGLTHAMSVVVVLKKPFSHISSKPFSIILFRFSTDLF